MKILFSKDFGKVDFTLDEENWEDDFLKCQKIEKLINTEEWLTLLQIFSHITDKYLDIVTSVKPQEQSFRENAIYSARMSGFLQGIGAARKIVDAYNGYRKQRLKELEETLDETRNGHAEFVPE